MSEIATNRKALRDYHILDRYEAGVELRGTEVKSIRQGKINISDAFARIEKGQVWLYNLDIQPYDKASGFSQHEPRRTRRLLLHRREIDKLFGYSNQKGLSLPVLRAYFEARGSRSRSESGAARPRAINARISKPKRRPARHSAWWRDSTSARAADLHPSRPPATR